MHNPGPHCIGTAPKLVTSATSQFLAHRFQCRPTWHILIGEIMAKIILVLLAVPANEVWVIIFLGWMWTVLRPMLVGSEKLWSPANVISLGAAGWPSWSELIFVHHSWVDITECNILVFVFIFRGSMVNKDYPIPIWPPSHDQRWLSQTTLPTPALWRQMLTPVKSKALPFTKTSWIPLHPPT